MEFILQQLSVNNWSPVNKNQPIYVPWMHRWMWPLAQQIFNVYLIKLHCLNFCLHRCHSYGEKRWIRHLTKIHCFKKSIACNKHLQFPSECVEDQPGYARDSWEFWPRRNQLSSNKYLCQKVWSRRWDVFWYRNSIYEDQCVGIGTDLKYLQMKMFCTRLDTCHTGWRRVLSVVC